MTTNHQLNIGGREEQQDSSNISKNKYSTFLILADGMGGHKGGAMASSTLVNEAMNLYKQKNNIIYNVQEFFQEIIDNTISSLKKQVENNNDKKTKLDPHTTCILALIQDGAVYYGHIGDSRLYLFENKEFIKRTKDHSVPQMLLNMDEITEEEMATHPDQNRLLKSIGIKKDVKITYHKEELAHKDFVILICSDGFWEYVSKNEMIKYLYSNDIKTANKKMINLALKRGGKEGDNISVATYMNNSNTSYKASIMISIFIIMIIPLLVYFMVFSNKGANNIVENNISKNTITEDNTSNQLSNKENKENTK